MKILAYNNGCVREEIITKHLRERIVEEGHEKCYSAMDADVIIYVTCAGVKKSIVESLKDISAFMLLKKKDAKLIITGCLTRIDFFFDELKKEENVYVVKNIDFVVPIFNIINNENKRNTTKTKLDNRTRFSYDSNVSIQFMLCNGCINKCSFCKENYLNTKVTSIPYDIAFNYLKSLVETGTRAITLSGENLTLYGIDLYGKPVLHKFIHDLCALPGLMFLTINEVTVQNMYLELLNELISQEKIGEVGIQIETVSDPLLKLMNRNHDFEKLDYVITSLTNAGKLINTVLMSGFPTETVDDMNLTINYLKDKHIYTELLCEYCDFECIPSGKLPQFKAREKRKHTMYLRKAIIDINKDALLHNIDKTKVSIVAQKTDKKVFLRSFFFGYTIKKEYQDANIGDIVELPANNVVHLKRSKIGYQYRH